MDFPISLHDFTGGESIRTATNATNTARYNVMIKNPVKTKIIKAIFEEYQFGSKLILLPTTERKVKLIAFSEIQMNLFSNDCSGRGSTIDTRETNPTANTITYAPNRYQESG